MSEGQAIAKRINTGSVNINDTLITFANHSLPFGGNKQSGVGRYHSKMGLRAFTNVKSITEFPWDLYNKELYWYPIVRKGDELILEALKLLFSLDTGKRIKSLFNVASIIIKTRLK
jgi:Aldehyde dehydrogenase family